MKKLRGHFICSSQMPREKQASRLRENSWWIWIGPALTATGILQTVLYKSLDELGVACYVNQHTYIKYYTTLKWTSYYQNNVSEISQKLWWEEKAGPKQCTL